MLRLAVAVLAACTITFAADPADTGQKAQDSSTMSPDVHAPLFRTQRPVDPGAITDEMAPGDPTAKADYSRMARKNFIDEYIFGKMEKDHIPHAPLATDQEFLRRVMLDLTGRIPTPAQVREFEADTAADKRPKLIDKLIASSDFVDKWSYYYMDLFRSNGKMQRGADLFHREFKDSLAADRPYDDLARSIVSSSAKSNFVVPDVNPMVREHVEGKTGLAPDHGDDFEKVNQQDTTDEVSINYARIFLGMNISCISCHNGAGHLEKVNAYLAKKKRSDFFQDSAFFGQTRYIQWIDNSEFRMGLITVDDLGDKYDTKQASMLRVNRTGGPDTPKFLLTDETPRPGADPREELARMITSSPQFSRATVNMFWAKLMGKGIVEPWDEFDPARQDPNNVPAGWDVQPSHPELLTKLAQYFRDNNYSIHKLFAVICNSNAYQLSARFPGEWNETYSKYYARKFVRMLDAEEIHDAITAATERPATFGSARRGRPKAALPGAGAQAELTAAQMNADEPPPQAPVDRAMRVTVPSPRGELKSFMEAFGQANRGTPAHPPQASPLQPIMLIRSPEVNDRVLAAKDSRLQRLLGAYPDNGKVVEELFMATLSREPSPEEKAFATSVMAKDRVQGGQNIQWALLNLAEFLYNF